MSDNIFGTASTPSLISVAEAAAKVMKLDEHCGVCDEQGLEEKVNLKKLKKDYLKNEDENRHTENYLMLAKAFGTPAEVKKVQEIMKRNEKQGSTSKADSDWMYKNINKYYDKIRNEEVEIDEAVLAGKDYKYDGKVVKISKKNFSKVHKDFKNSTKGKERMMINDPKTGGSISVPVQFEEVELDEKAKKIKQLHLFNTEKEAIKKAKEIGGQVAQNKRDGKYAAVIFEEVELVEKEVAVPPYPSSSSSTSSN